MSPSALQSSHFVDNNKVLAFDFDPNATTATEISWQDMSDYGELTVIFIRTIGTGNATLKIMSNPESDGSGTDYDVKTHGLANGQPDAVGDKIVTGKSP